MVSTVFLPASGWYPKSIRQVGTWEEQSLSNKQTSRHTQMRSDPRVPLGGHPESLPHTRTVPSVWVRSPGPGAADAPSVTSQGSGSLWPGPGRQGQGSRVRADTPGQGQILPCSGQVLKPLCVSLCICKMFPANRCGDEMRSRTCSLAGKGLRKCPP